MTAPKKQCINCRFIYDIKDEECPCGMIKYIIVNVELYDEDGYEIQEQIG